MVSVASLPRYYSYIKRGLKVYPSAVFGPKGQDILANAYRAQFTAENAVKYNIFSKQWWTQLKNGTKAAGKASEAYAASFAKQGFWKSMWKSVKGIPTTIAAGWRAGGIKAAAKGAGSVGQYWGKFKGALAGVGKKMPIIGSLLLVAFELPNIFKATKNEGLVQGAVETAKAGARIGGGVVGASIGSAIGTAIFPGVGSAIGGIVGWIAGEWAAKKVVGKSYSEKQEDLQNKINNGIGKSQSAAPLGLPGAIPPQYSTLPFNGYPITNDFMYNAMKKQVDYKA